MKMNILKKIKSLFIKDTIEQKKSFVNISRGTINDFKDIESGQITKSAIEYNKNKRFLKLNNNDCAMVIHQKGQIEIILTKLYDKENQIITPEEQTLMSIAIFLKQPGFAEMLRHEFHQIAMRNVNDLTENNNIQKGQNE